MKAESLSSHRNETHVSRALSLQTMIAQATADVELTSFRDCFTSNARGLEEFLLRQQRPTMHYLARLAFKKTVTSSNP